MKRRFLLLSIVVAMFSITINAAETTVYTSLELATAVAAAQDGDVIVIGQSDSALVQTALNVTKKITIKAASTLTEKPMLRLGIKLKNGSSIHLNGLFIYYDTDASGLKTDSKYAIQVVDELSTIDFIRISNCEAANFGRGLVRADHSTNVATIGEINIDNTIVRNASSVSTTYASLSIKTAKVSKISITNSTFLDALSGVVSSEEATTPINFLMDKVTIYNCALKGNKDIVGLSKAPAGSNITISNTLMYYSKTVAESDTIARSAINFASTATLSLTNSVVLSNLFPTKTVAVVKPASTHSAWTTFDQVSTVTEVIMNADYTIQMLPVQLTTIGDPRGHATVSGVEMPELSSFMVYPNPATDHVYFAREFVKADVYTILGMRVKSAVNAAGISIADLNNGQYIIRVEDEKGMQHIQKIVKK